MKIIYGPLGIYYMSGTDSGYFKARQVYLYCSIHKQGNQKYLIGHKKYKKKRLQKPFEGTVEKKREESGTTNIIFSHTN